MSDWHRSSYSDSTGGNCVEVSEGAQTLVRDSQHRDRSRLAFPADEWAAFILSLKNDGVS